MIWARKGIENFIQKRVLVSDTFSPVKERRVKSNSQEWEIVEKISLSDEFVKKFEILKLHFDKEIFKEVKDEVLFLL